MDRISFGGFFFVFKMSFFFCEILTVHLMAKSLPYFQAIVESFWILATLPSMEETCSAIPVIGKTSDQKVTDSAEDLDAWVWMMEKTTRWAKPDLEAFKHDEFIWPQRREKCIFNGPFRKFAIVSFNSAIAYVFPTYFFNNAHNLNF